MCNREVFLLLLYRGHILENKCEAVGGLAHDFKTLRSIGVKAGKKNNKLMTKHNSQYVSRKGIPVHIKIHQV